MSLCLDLCSGPCLLKNISNKLGMYLKAENALLAPLVLGGNYMLNIDRYDRI